jgi:hypothetical protein
MVRLMAPLEFPHAKALRRDAKRYGHVIDLMVH